MSEDKLRGPSLRKLKSLGQLLEPVVHIGKGGLSEALLASVNSALDQHELIKVKFDALKEQKKLLAPELAARTHSHLVQRVGNVVVLYRQHAEASRRKIELGMPGETAGKHGPGQPATETR